METNQIDFVGRAGCTGNAPGLRLPWARGIAFRSDRPSHIYSTPRGYLSHWCWLKASFTSEEGFSEDVKRGPLMIQPHASHPHAENVPSSSHTSSLAIKRSLPPALYALGISLILHKFCKRFWASLNPFAYNHFNNPFIYRLHLARGLRKRTASQAERSFSSDSSGDASEISFANPGAWNISPSHK
jgi:hypothetical protein